MNIDENVRKMLMALLKKWKLLVIFAVIGALIGYAYTSNFVSPTYTSTVEFQAFAVDTEKDMSEQPDSQNPYTSNEAIRISNTSKMNYAMKMIDTYIEIMSTNDFNTRIADEMNKRINSEYSAGTVKGSTTVESVDNTAMFKVTVTTTDADLSYEIAHQIELTVPEVIKESSNEVVNASVKDKPLRAQYATGRGYTKKCAIAAIAGIALAAAYVVLRTLLDVRVRSAEELTAIYSIPVLASIPEFDKSSASSKVTDYSVKEDK